MDFVFFQYFLYFPLLFVNIRASESDREYVVKRDILFPYDSSSAIEQLKSHDRHRVTRECQPAKYGNITYEVYPGHYSIPHTLPLVESRPFGQKIGKFFWDQSDVFGHYFAVHHPDKTFSVLEPSFEGGCTEKVTSTVTNTSINYKQQCILATNAGFFEVDDGTCLGDLVSDGREVVNTYGVQNAHFGITKSGDIFVGYLPRKSHLEETFTQLITGILWLVRNGESYLDVSMKTECPDNQNSGSLQYFADVKSARLAIGHDKDGRVIIVQVDGRTGETGISLWDLTDLLISWGVVNAINLDGGGSVTTLLNDTWVNMGGDDCKTNTSFPDTYRCQRKLTTTLCVHEPLCSPEDCNGHGECIIGLCRCHGNWVGSTCHELQCGVLNCTSHGLCTEGGCICEPGWYTDDCSAACLPGKYGLSCSADCRCHNGATCLPQDGTCVCPPGYTGDTCQQECPFGRYGQDCRQICYCQNSCVCDRVTGACDISLERHSKLLEDAQCLSNKMTAAKEVVQNHQEQYAMWLIAVIFLSVLAAGSLVLNIILLCRSNITRNSCYNRDIRDTPTKPSPKRRKKVPKRKPFRLMSDSDTTSLTSEEDTFGSRDPRLETRIFLTENRERRPGSSSKTSPSSPGLYMQSRTANPPDVTQSVLADNISIPPEETPLQSTSCEGSPTALSQKDLGNFSANERTLNKYRDLFSLIDFKQIS